MAEKVNKNQHWVPRFYLRYFSTPESRNSRHPKIWALPTESGGEFLTNLANVATEQYLYTPRDKSGNRDTILDKKLTDCESLLATLWPKIANDHYPLDDGFRRGLSLFISTLYLRHPSKLKRHKQFQKSILDATANVPRDSAGRPLISTLQVGNEDLPISAADWDYLLNASEDEVKQSWNDLIFKEAGFIAKHLLTKPWAMIYSSDEVFATSDHPVVVSHRDIPNPSLNAPDAVVMFPVSPTRVLWIGDKRFEDGKAFQLRPGREHDFNFLTFRSAKRFLFAPWHPLKTISGVVQTAETFVAQRKQIIENMAAASRNWFGKVGRNEACPCGSGEKYKRCCGQ